MVPELCRYYARGYCARGASCFYSHSLPVRSPPDPVAMGQNETKPEPVPGADTCPDYAEGFCPEGPACSRTHASEIKVIIGWLFT